jgi:hypothetical protein
VQARPRLHLPSHLPGVCGRQRQLAAAHMIRRAVVEQVLTYALCCSTHPCRCLRLLTVHPTPSVIHGTKRSMAAPLRSRRTRAPRACYEAPCTWEARAELCPLPPDEASVEVPHLYEARAVLSPVKTRRCRGIQLALRGCPVSLRVACHGGTASTLSVPQSRKPSFVGLAAQRDARRRSWAHGRQPGCNQGA